MGDLLGEDYSLVEKNALYRSLDKLLVHKSALFDHLSQRWKDLFGAKFDVLLYDLTKLSSKPLRTIFLYVPSSIGLQLPAQPPPRITSKSTLHH